MWKKKTKGAKYKVMFKIARFCSRSIWTFKHKGKKKKKYDSSCLFKYKCTLVPTFFLPVYPLFRCIFWSCSLNCVLLETPFVGYYRLSVILFRSVFQSASCSVYVIDLEIDIVLHHCWHWRPSKITPRVPVEWCSTVLQHVDSRTLSIFILIRLKDILILTGMVFLFSFAKLCRR